MKNLFVFFLIFTLCICSASVWAGEIIPLTPPSLPEIRDTMAYPPQWVFLTLPQLPEIDPANTWKYDGVDLSGGMNSAFLIKPANQCDESVNFLPDSFPGIVARKGYSRLTPVDSSYKVYGLGVLEDQIVAQMDYRTMKFEGATYTPTTIPYYSHVTKVDSIRTRTRTFFTPVEGGLLITNGTDEPAFYDGNVAKYLGIIEVGSISNSSGWVDGLDSITFHDSSKTWTADQWIGYAVKIWDTDRHPDSLRIRIIIDNDSTSFTAVPWNSTFDRGEYQIVGIPDQGAVIDSGTATSTSAWNYFTPGSINDWGVYSSVSASEKMLFVEIISGKGYGQLRHIRFAANPKLHIDPLWNVQPNSTSDYIIYWKFMPRGNNAVIHNDYFIGSGGDPFRNRLYVSSQGNFGDFGTIPEDYITAPGDINYILNFGGQVSIWGDDWVGRLTDASNLHVFVKNIGCPYPHTIATWGGNIYWLANNGVWTTKGSGIAYAEGEAGLTKISAPTDNHFKDLRRRAKYAGAGFDGTGKYWLSISTDSDTIPDETFVWDTRTEGWWPQDCAFSYYAFSEYPGDTSGFIFARQDSGYIFKYGGTTDAGAVIEYTYKKSFCQPPVNEKQLRSLWLYGSEVDSIWVKFYENETATCAESTKITGTGKTRMFEYVSGVQAEKITVELKSWDTDLVINSWGIELEDLGRSVK